MTHEVPSDWKLAALEDICEVLDSKRVPLNSEDRRDKKGSIPYWGANGIVDYIDDFIFNEPLLLMAEDGGYFNEARTRPICHRLDGKAWVNNHAHVLRVLAPTLRDWVYYWFVHRDITQHINGSTRSKLNQKDLRRLPICLPPLPEQKKIAEVLSSVDEAIAATKAVIDQAKQVKKGLLQTLFSATSASDCKETVLGPVPKAWDVRPASEVCEEVIDCKNRTPPFTESGYVVVRTSNVRDGNFRRDKLSYTDRVSFEEWTKRGRPRAGDVIITREAPVGEVCAVPEDIEVCLGQRMMLYRPNTQLLDSGYLLYALQSAGVQNRLFILAGGSTVGHVRVGDIRGLPLPIPPMNIQKRIFQTLASIDKQLQASDAELSQLQNLKLGLMSDLLTGRKRVEVPDA